eukprot:s1558_g2.t1
MAKPVGAGKVKASLRCASPEPEDAFGSFRRKRRSRSRSRSKSRSKSRSDEERSTEAKAEKKRRQKEFAWMDSEDEASDNGDAEEEEKPRQRQSPKADERKEDSEHEAERRSPAPTTAAEVQTLGQMMRLMESWQRQRGKILRLPMPELSEVCQAAARVKYYDAGSFADIMAAVKVHLRGHTSLRPEDIAGVLSGLADVNGYEKELFDLAAQALNRTTGQILRPARKAILDAFKKVKHRTDTHTVLREMSEQEAKARYEDKCYEVAASWQKPGACSTTWRGFG